MRAYCTGRIGLSPPCAGFRADGARTRLRHVTAARTRVGRRRGSGFAVDRQRASTGHGGGDGDLGEHLLDHLEVVRVVRSQPLPGFEVPVHGEDGLALDNDLPGYLDAEVLPPTPPENVAAFVDAARS